MADFRKTKDTALKYMLRTTLPSFVVFRGHSHRPSSTMRFDASNDDREFHLPIDHRPPSYPPPGRRCRQFRATIPLPPGGEEGGVASYASPRSGAVPDTSYWRRSCSSRTYIDVGSNDDDEASKLGRQGEGRKSRSHNQPRRGEFGE